MDFPEYVRKQLEDVAARFGQSYAEMTADLRKAALTNLVAQIRGKGMEVVTIDPTPAQREEIARIWDECLKPGHVMALSAGEDVRFVVPDLIVRATVDGERLRLRYAPQPGMTGQEAGWAAQLATFAANPDVDWGDWIATRGMLKHFVVVE